MDVLLDLGYIALTAAMLAASMWLVHFCATLGGDGEGGS
jgi:hypothetical protein